MNKCVVCTFFKMVWEGLWNNVCPSVDTKKKEKPLGFRRFMKEVFTVFLFALFLFALFAIPFAALMYLFVKLIEWLNLEFIILIVFGLFLVIGVIGILFVIIEWSKIRIDCIRIYWRKAKEACE